MQLFQLSGNVKEQETLRTAEKLHLGGILSAFERNLPHEESTWYC